MINRREALKSLAFIPLLGAKGSSASAIQVGTKHFLMFFDVQCVDQSNLAETFMGGFPDAPLDAVVYFVPLKLRYEQTIEDAIRLYEVS